MIISPVLSTSAIGQKRTLQRVPTARKALEQLRLHRRECPQTSRTRRLPGSEGIEMALGGSPEGWTVYVKPPNIQVNLGRGWDRFDA